MDKEPNPRLAYELALENFEALGVLEHNGELYLPTQLRVRNAKGGLDALDVLLRMPSHEQYRRARLESRKAMTDAGYDLELDKDRFTEAENHWLLSFALRDRETKSQLEPTVEMLLQRYSDATLAEAYTRLQVWIDMQDPRYGKLTGEQLWLVVAAIATEGNILPLAGMPGYEQATLITVMAQEAWKSPSAPSSPSSRSTFDPAASPQRKSA